MKSGHRLAGTPSREEPQGASPKVSVVVPNYNYARFLERRIRSVLDQTYTDFEVVYLDDASTDDSEAVFARFRDDPRIRAYRSTENSGSAYRQWNEGVRLSRGEYVWVAQADDYAEKGLLATLVPVLDRNPGVGLVYCQSLAVDEAGRTLHSMARRTEFLDPERWNHDFVNDGRDECRRYLLFRNTIPNLSAVLFRREVFEQAGGADETLHLVGDQLTWIRMLLISDVAFVAEPLNHFRHHEGSIRSNVRRAGLGVLGNYEIAAFLRDALPLTEAELDAACENALRSWTKKVLRLRNRIPLATSVRIARVARGVDPRLGRRLVRRLLGLPAPGGRAPWPSGS